MNKLKKNLILYLGSFFIILASVLILIVISTNGFGIFNQNKKEVVNLYFLDSTLSKLIKEEQKVDISNGDRLYNIVSLLIKGPENIMENKRAIPEGTKILSLTRKGSLATVDFSSEFKSGMAASDMLAAFTVVYSLCDFDGIEQVSVFVEGEPLVDTDKKPLGALAKDDIVNEGDEIKKQDTVELTLYFPSSDFTSLVKETRKVALNDNTSKAQLIVNELMRGSSDETNIMPIPNNAKLSSIEIKNFTCFVNFSKEFTILPKENEQGEVMTIYAIVNSLTELEEIKNVQFLIDGQKTESFGSVVFNQPFERNESIISK